VRFFPGCSDSGKKSLEHVRPPRAFAPTITPILANGPEELEMEKAVVLIEGALTGIGRATAVAFTKKGAKLVVARRRDEAGNALAGELRSLGSRL
jgi:hypothetical protein